MKKTIVVFVLGLVFASVGHAETYYRISESDFQALKSCMKRIQNYFENNEVYNGYCWGWDVYGINNYLIKSIEDSKVDTDSDSLRRIKYAKALEKAAKETDKQLGLSDNLNVDEKLSIIGGKIQLLENEIDILKDKMKK